MAVNPLRGPDPRGSCGLLKLVWIEQFKADRVAFIGEAPTVRGFFGAPVPLEVGEELASLAFGQLHAAGSRDTLG